MFSAPGRAGLRQPGGTPGAPVPWRCAIRRRAATRSSCAGAGPVAVEVELLPLLAMPMINRRAVARTGTVYRRPPLRVLPTQTHPRWSSPATVAEQYLIPIGSWASHACGQTAQVRSVCSPARCLATGGCTSVVGMFLGFPFIVAHSSVGDQGVHGPLPDRRRVVVSTHAVAPIISEQIRLSRPACRFIRCRRGPERYLHATPKPANDRDGQVKSLMGTPGPAVVRRC